ncbi:MAG: S-layer homology domain-containing protein [Oscillospiraceae bacterium]|nr:S-layer homology domain-containing protein [Oscillospiraceae bacterium]
MKKKHLIIVAAVMALLFAVSAYASGGSTSDPLISLSHLTDVFKPSVDKAVSSKLDQSDTKLYDSAVAAVNAASSDSGSSASVAESYAEMRLNKGDALKGSTGTNVIVLAGSIKVEFTSGTVVDVTAGTEVASGTVLTVNNRYMVAEDTSASFTVTSKTACLDYMGPYSFSYSNETDYTGMADALKTLNLLKGSYTGYGSGYDLEVAPTRLQALIMFIRVLGEEDEALAFTGTCPFTDIAPGTNSYLYVGYAYEKGYTNGYTATLFKPGNKVNAYQYTEFILRALKYSSAENTNISGALTNARDYGVITEGELSMLLSASPFTRAELVYLSYYALDAYLFESTTTLRQHLMNAGVFNTYLSNQAASQVSGSRL